MKLQVTNIERNLGLEDFRKLFEKFGPLEECTLVMDQKTGKSKGFGFVVIADKKSAHIAKNSLDGRLVNGKMLKVKIC